VKQSRRNLLWLLVCLGIIAVAFSFGGSDRRLVRPTNVEQLSVDGITLGGSSQKTVAALRTAGYTQEKTPDNPELQIWHGGRGRVVVMGNPGPVRLIEGTTLAVGGRPVPASLNSEQLSAELVRLGFNLEPVGDPEVSANTQLRLNGKTYDVTVGFTLKGGRVANSSASIYEPKVKL
jgi:hypothetical protein